MSYHTFIAVGNLGRDAEMRYTPQGTAVANFNLAIDDGYKNAEGEKIDRTIWARISVWGKFAEALNPYLVKGQKVLVEGKLVCNPETGGPRVYEKNDGTSGASFEVRAGTVRLLGSKNGASHEETGEPVGEGAGTADEDNIPF